MNPSQTPAKALSSAFGQHKAEQRPATLRVVGLEVPFLGAGEDYQQMCCKTDIFLTSSASIQNL